jgi:hypothetical protein
VTIDDVANIRYIKMIKNRRYIMSNLIKYFNPSPAGLADVSGVIERQRKELAASKSDNNRSDKTVWPNPRHIEIDVNVDGSAFVKLGYGDGATQTHYIDSVLMVDNILYAAYAHQVPTENVKHDITFNDDDMVY